MHQYATDSHLAARERRARFQFTPARPTHDAPRLALFWLTVVLLVGMAFVWLRHSRRSETAVVAEPGIDFVSLLSHVDRMHHGLPVGLTPTWDVTASGKARVSDDVRAVRIGARIADFEVVARARNSQSRAAYYDRELDAIVAVKWYSLIVARFARNLAASLDDVRDGGRAAELYRYLEHRGVIEGTVDPSVIRMARQASLRDRPGFVALGNWLEASRIAARREDGAFFRRVEVRAAAQRALTAAHVPPAGRLALRRVRDLVLSKSTTDFVTLDAWLTAALRAVTNRPIGT